jgi:hypothetical protein
VISSLVRRFMVQILTYIRYMTSVRMLAISLILFLGAPVYASTDTVTIKITVIDSYNKQFLGGVSIINPTSSLTLSTDNRGNCTFTALKTDTLFLFYPGYKVAKFSAADSALKRQYWFMLAMEPLSTGLNQPVIIKAPKTLEQIEAERKNLGVTPKELEKPIIEPFTSPISALYDILSKRAQEREKLKQQIEEDDRRKIFKELLRYYNENGLIDLPESYYDDFINYCNLPTDFLKYNTDYEITKTIIGLYNKYGRLNGLIK